MRTDEQDPVRQYDSTERLDARVALHRYGTNTEPWYVWVSRHLPFRKGHRVLEVGAGTGDLWTVRGVTGIDLVLTDRADAMCRALDDKFRQVARVQRCDADRLPFGDATFDGVVANHMLYYADDPVVALREIHRVLRPGGWLAASTNGRDHMDELRVAARAAGVPFAAPSVLHGFSSQTGRDLLARQFEHVQVHTYADEIVTPVAEPVLAYMVSCADRKLDDAEAQALRHVVDDVIATHEVFRVRKDAVLFLARKA